MKAVHRQGVSFVWRRRALRGVCCVRERSDRPGLKYPALLALLTGYLGRREAFWATPVSDIVLGFLEWVFCVRQSMEEKWWWFTAWILGSVAWI